MKPEFAQKFLVHLPSGRRATMLVGLMLGTCAPALSAQTEFVEIAPDTQIRLLASESVDVNGVMQIAVEIRMPESTHTYWRVPGETGIPLIISHARSPKISALTTHWPLPTSSIQSGYIDYIYAGDVIFPMDVQVDPDVDQIALDISLGVCDEICVPVKVALDADIDLAKADMAAKLRIQQALNRVPIIWPHESPLAGEARIDEAARTLIFETNDKFWSGQSLIVSTGKPDWIFGSANHVSPTKVQVPFVAGSRANSQFPNEVQMLFDTPDGPYQFLVPIALDTGVQ